MKAAIINEFGNPKVFKISNIDGPILNPDQIIIKVKAVGINPIDWKQRKGNHKLILGSPFPIVLGYDICGEVVEVGNEINKFKKGDIVFGSLDNKYGGALAEFALGHENCFSHKPKNITDVEAAAFPMVSLTVLQAFRDKSRLKTGQTVLINGASGGIGHIAMQIAKIMGFKIIAVASNKSKDFVEQYKPDVFIDYTQHDLLKSDIKADLFLDVACNYSFPKTKRILNRNGLYLNLAYIDTLKKMPIYLLNQIFAKGKKGRGLLMKHSSSDLEIIAKWISENKLKVHVDRTFQLEQISEAHEYAQTGHNKGKNVIVISN
jgi:NADPH:quinone reductase-like Zn-dependent oxidoreductase